MNAKKTLSEFTPEELQTASRTKYAYQREYNKQWRANNRDKVSEYNKRYRRKHSEKLKAGQIRYWLRKAEESEGVNNG